VYSIVLSGYIPSQKAKEFRQHMKQMSGKPENQMYNLEVFKDVLLEDLYRVKMSFTVKDEMFSFMKSDHYSVITGSFKALGFLRDQHIETYSELNENED
jgi:hypothetical protein